MVLWQQLQTWNKMSSPFPQNLRVKFCSISIEHVKTARVMSVAHFFSFYCKFKRGAKMNKHKVIKITAKVLTWTGLPYLHSSFSFNVVFYVQHVHKSCPFSLLKFMGFNSIRDRAVLTYMTQRFLPGHKFFKSFLPSSHSIYSKGWTSIHNLKNLWEDCSDFLILKFLLSSWVYLALA